MNNLLKKKIEKWIFENIQNSSWKTHDHFHIDEISKNYENKKSWIEGGFEALELCNEIITKGNLTFSIELAFDLYSTSHYLGLNIKSLSDLEKEFDDTPPAVYIFPRNNESWIETLSLGKKVVLNNFENNHIQILYFESKLRDYIEYSRRLAFIYK